MRGLARLTQILVLAGAQQLALPASAEVPTPPAPRPTSPPEPDPCAEIPPPGCRSFTQAELRHYEEVVLRITRAVPTPRGWRRTPPSQIFVGLGRAVPFKGGGTFPEDGKTTLEFVRGERSVSIDINIDAEQLLYNGRIVLRAGDGFFVDQVTWGKITDASIVTYHTPPGGRWAHLRSVSMWVSGERRDVEAVARSIDHAAIFKLLREELERSRAARPRRFTSG